MIDLNQAFSGMNVEGASRVRWTLPPTLPYFDGHFPGNPIFPAVGIVDASLHALAKLLGRDVEIEAVPSAKFTQVLGPGIPVALDFDRNADGSWNVEWSVTETEKVVASLHLALHGKRGVDD